MVSKKEFLVLGAIFVMVFVSLGLVSAFVSMSTNVAGVGGTNVQHMRSGTNWSYQNDTYNASVVFFNVTFFNNNTAFAGAGGGNITFKNTTTAWDGEDNYTINATIWVRQNVSGAAWTRIGTVFNWTIWGTAVLNKTSISGNISLGRTVLGDGVYHINVTVTNASSHNISMNYGNLTHNVTIENDPPMVYYNNITLTYSYRGVSNISVFANGIRNYSGTLTINATIVNPGAGVQSVVFNITNGTTRTVSYNQTLTHETHSDTTKNNSWSATVDTSIFTAGFYNLSITANGSGKSYMDAAGLVNNTAVITNIYFDNTVPSVTFSCTPANVGSGSTETCTCTATDTTSTTQTFTASPSTASTGTQTVYCVSWDSAGNSYTASTTYNVELSGGGSTSSSSSSSSSAVGTGGGGVVAETAIVKEHTFTRIEPGTPGVASGYETSFGVKEISIDVTEATDDVEVSVTRYDGRPSAVSEKAESVYSYIKIDENNLLDNLKKATVIIQVAKSWAETEGIVKEDVVLSGYSSGTWSDLDTTFSSEDDTHYYYTVDVTEFGYMAIAEKSLAVVVTADSDEAALGTAAWIGIIVGAVILVGLVLWLMKRKK